VLGVASIGLRAPGLVQTIHVVMEKDDFQTTPTCHCQNPQPSMSFHNSDALPMLIHVFVPSVEIAKADKWIIVMCDYNPFTHMQ